jgi:hypothetical protein
MTTAAATAPGTAMAYASRRRGIRFDHIGLFVSGATLAVLEVSIRSELDLPLLETILVVWSIAEFASRRLRLETARA